MRYEQHCASCLKTLNGEFGEVHEWLDCYRGKKGKDFDFTIPPPCRHWVMRHHEEGLVKLVDHFSKIYDSDYYNKLVEAARVHIYDDCGCIPNKKDYDERGFLNHPMWEKKSMNGSTRGFI